MVINYQKNYWVLSLFLKMSKSNLHFTQQCGWYYCVLKETEFFFLQVPEKLFPIFNNERNDNRLYSWLPILNFQFTFSNFHEVKDWKKIEGLFDM